MPQLGSKNSTLLEKTDGLDEYHTFFKILRELTGIYLFPFIGIFGIIGSIFVAIVYKQSKKCSTNLYLVALSLSDIVKLLNDLSYFLVSVISKFDSNLGDNIFFILYSYSHYIFVLTALNTSWLTCAIAFDRYNAVVKSHGKRIQRNYFKSIVTSLSILAMSVFVAVPAPLFHEQIQFIDPVSNLTVKKLADTKLGRSSFKKVYQYINGMLRGVIPLLLLIYLNYRIIRVVYKNKMQKKKKSKSRVTLMLISIVLTFTVCIFPDAIMTMMQLGYANENFLVRGIREITDLLMAINSASTFPICFYFSTQFRMKFKHLFQLIRLRKHSSSSNAMEAAASAAAADENSNLVQARKSILVNLPVDNNKNNIGINTNLIQLKNVS